MGTLLKILTITTIGVALFSVAVVSRDLIVERRERRNRKKGASEQ